MSAFVCTDRHIATIAQAYAQLAGRTPTDVTQIATLLKRENIRSVNYRYRRRDKLVACNLQDAQTLDLFGGSLAVGDVLELLHCLKYQSCERPDHQKSSAFSLMRTIAEVLEPLAAPPKSSMWCI